MIGITNETITMPMIQICTPNGFWAGFVWGGISILVLYFIFRFIYIWRDRE